MNPAVELKWLAAKSNLLRDIGETEPVVCHIPQWEPVTLEMGLRWLQSSIYEGFRVTFSVAKSDQGAQVDFTISEPDVD
ncbi:MAG: hypothetical protein L6R28_14765 [Planctomycetes bacterium]|nr:hypothetical protein [Planctomycetota bacterium]